jgi:hypothetical protein
MNALWLWLALPAMAAGLAQAAPFTTIARGDGSGQLTARQVVVRTPAEWQTLWKFHGRTEKLPEIDFNTRTVVGVFLGTKPSTGHQVEIVGVRTEGDTLIVEYRQQQPARGIISAQILTAPFHLISVPRHAGPVKFVQQ